MSCILAFRYFLLAELDLDVCGLCWLLAFWKVYLFQVPALLYFLILGKSQSFWTYIVILINIKWKEWFYSPQMDNTTFPGRNSADASPLGLFVVSRGVHLRWLLKRQYSVRTWFLWVHEYGCDTSSLPPSLSRSGFHLIYLKGRASGIVPAWFIPHMVAVARRKPGPRTLHFHAAICCCLPGSLSREPGGKHSHPPTSVQIRNASSSGGLTHCAITLVSSTPLCCLKNKPQLRNVGTLDCGFSSY